MNVNDVLVDRLVTQLLKRNATVATAESCTGGWIAKTITDIPGSSEWFEYGFVSYGNNAKTDLLGVDSGLIDRYGAVSEEVARAMVEGAAARAGAQFAMAVTEKQWGGALDIGRQIISDFPNSKMSEEIRGKLSILQQNVQMQSN